MDGLEEEIMTEAGHTRQLQTVLIAVGVMFRVQNAAESVSAFLR
jgi:hypothetical protein